MMMRAIVVFVAFVALATCQPSPPTAVTEGTIRCWSWDNSNPDADMADGTAVSAYLNDVVSNDFDSQPGYTIPNRLDCFYGQSTPRVPVTIGAIQAEELYLGGTSQNAPQDLLDGLSSFVTVEFEQGATTDYLLPTMISPDGSAISGYIILYQAAGGDFQYQTSPFAFNSISFSAVISIDGVSQTFYFDLVYRTNSPVPQSLWSFNVGSLVCYPYNPSDDQTVQDVAPILAQGEAPECTVMAPFDAAPGYYQTTEELQCYILARSPLDIPSFTYEFYDFTVDGESQDVDDEFIQSVFDLISWDYSEDNEYACGVWTLTIDTEAMDDVIVSAADYNGGTIKWVPGADYNLVYAWKYTATSPDFEFSDKEIVLSTTVFTAGAEGLVCSLFTVLAAVVLAVLSM